jgi:3-oxoadipate CoA-transferase, alpha subunit
MVNKEVPSLDDAVADIPDGAIIHVSGFGGVGIPVDLCDAVHRQGAKELTIVNNGVGSGKNGMAVLIGAGRVRKIVCSFPRTPNPEVFQKKYQAGEIELELVPQGTLAERIRAAGAGVGAFYTPTSVGTPLGEGKETRVLQGREMVLEHPLHADFALVKADQADRWGNLTYRKSARNFGPIMCMAAKTTIVQVREIVPLGALDPEKIATPSIFVDRIVRVANPAKEA